MQARAKRLLEVACLPAFLLVTSAAAQPRSPAGSVGERLVVAAETYLGKPYMFGGRDGRRGCIQAGKRVRCPGGIDCQSLIFFAYERVLKTRWTRFSVFPSVSIRRKELGRPIAGLAGVLADEVDMALLAPGDVLFFLLEDYNLQADPALLVRNGHRYGTWHTGMVHSTGPGWVKVIHAKPGDKVVVEALGRVEFDGLFAVRWPDQARAKSRRSKTRGNP